MNANGSEIGALFSPSGRSLMFARDASEPKSGEFFAWQPRGRKRGLPHAAKIATEHASNTRRVSSFRYRAFSAPCPTRSPSPLPVSWT
ncbi:MAG: hypothetical protein JO278_00595 [Dyella sp.]|nr:hypothetical protein [Dyella sp.]